MPDAFETHLKVATSAGERTRGILYFLGIVSVTLLAVVWESDIAPWRDFRHEMISKAFLCYANNKLDNDDVPVDRKRDPDKNNCGYYYDYVKNYYIYLHYPHPDYDQKKEFFDYYLASWDAVSERYKELTKEYTEGASYPLPIIGIKVDRNNIFLFSSISITMIMALLTLSLKSEIKCAEDIRKLKIVDEEWKALAFVNTHIFAKSTNSKLFWLFLFLPLLLIIWDVAISYRDILVGHRPSGGWPWFSGHVICILLLFFTTWICYKSARKLDDEMAELVNQADQLQPRGI